MVKGTKQNRPTEGAAACYHQLPSLGMGAITAMASLFGNLRLYLEGFFGGGGGGGAQEGDIWKVIWLTFADLNSAALLALEGPARLTVMVPPASAPGSVSLPVPSALSLVKVNDGFEPGMVRNCILFTTG